MNQHVIVIMKSQLRAARVGSAAANARAGAIAGDQKPLMSELSQVHATHVKAYRLVNSFAATVSAGEESRLKANSAVAEVIPDVTIHGAAPDTAASLGTVAKTTTASALRTDGQHLADAQRDPRRLRHERPGPARPGGALADATSTRTTRTSRPRARWASPARA